MDWCLNAIEWCILDGTHLSQGWAPALAPTPGSALAAPGAAITTALLLMPFQCTYMLPPSVVAGTADCGDDDDDKLHGIDLLHIHSH